MQGILPLTVKSRLEMHMTACRCLDMAFVHAKSLLETSNMNNPSVPAAIPQPPTQDELDNKPW